MENNNGAAKLILKTATRDEWALSLFPRHLASVEAYKQFYELTGQDIRDFESMVFTSESIQAETRKKNLEPITEITAKTNTKQKKHGAFPIRHTVT